LERPRQLRCLRALQGLKLAFPCLNFQAPEAEPVGTCKFLTTSDEADPAPLRCVVLGPGGALYWLEGLTAFAKYLTPNGCLGLLGNQDAHGNPSTRPLLAMAKDSNQGLWFFDDRHFFRTAWTGLGIGPRSGAAADPSVYLAGIPEILSSTPDGRVLLAQGSNINLFGLTAKGQAKRTKLDGFESYTPLSAMIGEREADGRFGVLAYSTKLKDKLMVNVMPWKTKGVGSSPVLVPLKLPRGSRPGRFATTGSDELWFTDPARNAIVVMGKDANNAGGPTLEPPHPKSESHVLQGHTLELPHPRSEPHDIAWGPDEKIWFTETAGDRIGCVDSKHQVQEWDLPSGTLPEAIVGFQDGVMIFTCQGQNRIGSFRMAPPARSVPEKEEPAPEPLAPSERKTARLVVSPTEEEINRVFGPKSGAGEGKEEKKLPAPATHQRLDPAPLPMEGSGSAAILRTFQLSFPSRPASHIIVEHGHGRNRFDAGAWAEAYSGWEQLQDMFAAALQRAGGLSEDFDSDGSRVTILSSEDVVGTYLASRETGARKTTRSFKLVTGPNRRSLGPGMVVITAFPVR
jgi:hypothetical protein